MHLLQPVQPQPRLLSQVLADPSQVLGYIAVEHVLIEITVRGRAAFALRDDAAQQPAIVALDHESASRIAQTRARTIEIAGA